MNKHVFKNKLQYGAGGALAPPPAPSSCVMEQ